jgi:hypothetical protein
MQWLVLWLETFFKRNIGVQSTLPSSKNNTLPLGLSHRAGPGVSPARPWAWATPSRGATTKEKKKKNSINISKLRPLDNQQAKPLISLPTPPFQHLINRIKHRFTPAFHQI